MAEETPQGGGGAESGRVEMFDRAYVEQLRGEAASYRTKNKVLESQIAKHSDSAATIRKLSIDNHLLSKGTVDPKLIRFYLSEGGKLDDLDPSVEDWTTLLDDRVSDLIGRHPELKAAPRTPGRSGTDGSTGGHGGGPSGQLSRADAMRMTPEEVAAAFQSGHFNALLGRRP